VSKKDGLKKTPVGTLTLYLRMPLSDERDEIVGAALRRIKKGVTEKLGKRLQREWASKKPPCW